jgi:hypothetical protein
MARFDLTDAEWAIVGPLLPNKPRGDASQPFDDRWGVFVAVVPRGIAILQVGL